MLAKKRRLQGVQQVVENRLLQLETLETVPVLPETAEERPAATVAVTAASAVLPLPVAVPVGGTSRHGDTRGWSGREDMNDMLRKSTDRRQAATSMRLLQGVLRRELHTLSSDGEQYRLSLRSDEPYHVPKNRFVREAVATAIAKLSDGVAGLGSHSAMQLAPRGSVAPR